MLMYKQNQKQLKKHFPLLNLQTDYFLNSMSKNMA